MSVPQRNVRVVSVWHLASGTIRSAGVVDRLYLVHKTYTKLKRTQNVNR